MFLFLLAVYFHFHFLCETDLRFFFIKTSRDDIKLTPIESEYDITFLMFYQNTTLPSSCFIRIRHYLPHVLSEYDIIFLVFYQNTTLSSSCFIRIRHYLPHVLSEYDIIFLVFYQNIVSILFRALSSLNIESYIGLVNSTLENIYLVSISGIF